MIRLALVLFLPAMIRLALVLFRRAKILLVLDPFLVPQQRF